MIDADAVCIVIVKLRIAYFVHVGAARVVAEALGVTGGQGFGLHVPGGVQRPHCLLRARAVMRAMLRGEMLDRVELGLRRRAVRVLLAAAVRALRRRGAGSRVAPRRRSVAAEQRRRRRALENVQTKRRKLHRARFTLECGGRKSHFTTSHKLSRTRKLVIGLVSSLSIWRNYNFIFRLRIS